MMVSVSAMARTVRSDGPEPGCWRRARQSLRGRRMHCGRV